MSTATMTAPGRTPEQPREALKLANHVRAFRSRLKRDVGSGKTSARTVLLRPPLEAQTMKVRDLLMARKGSGPRRADALLREMHISPVRTLAGLSARQRTELANRLGEGT